MSIGLKSDSSGTSGSIVINGSDKIVVTSAGNVTAGTFTGAVVGAVTGNVTGNVTGSLTAGGSITSGVAVASTSGTAIDFTGIPSWAKRITVMFNGVSVNGVTDLFVQIGTSSGIENTGYLAVSDASSFTTAFGIRTQNASFAVKGAMVITTLGSNVWVMTTNTYIDTGTGVRNGSGSKTLGGTLDRVRITTSGADTFDAGSVNIMYEG